MATESKEMKWSLADPGMDLSERAGLAALYMNLKAAEEMDHDIAPLHWEPGDLTRDSVTVRWKTTAKDAFTQLFQWAWQVRDGVLYLPAVFRNDRLRNNAFLRVPMHNGILNTFLQHRTSRLRRGMKSEFTRRTEQLDEGQEIAISYQVLSYLKAVDDLDELFGPTGDFRKREARLSSWVMPGCTNRYPSDASTKNWQDKPWRGPARVAVLLMLAPIVNFYQRLRGKGRNWIFVVPDVHDLEEFNDIRPRLELDPRFVEVASLGDAALRFLAEYATRSIRKEIGVGCRVVAMGGVTYYQSQSIRKGVLDVSPTPIAIRRYQHLYRVMPNWYISLRKEAETAPEEPMVTDDAAEEDEETREKAGGFIKVPSGRGRIADNLVTGHPWYLDLFTPLIWDIGALERQRKKKPAMSLERLWFMNLSYQKGKLMELIKERDMWDTEEERLFVEAFWETLASLYKQEADAVERGGARKVEERWDDLNDEVKRSLMRAKTRELLRGTLAELFARAGRQSTIREHPATIWNLLNDPYDWKKARDLALLALASYQSEEKRSAVSSTVSTPKTEGA
jgi:CRISPR-associated protein Cas8a1/Csx13